MLTESLHTITAATNVARYILTYHGPEQYTSARHLADCALVVLGQGENAHKAGDPTVQRIVANCAKLLAEANYDERLATVAAGRAAIAKATKE